MTREFNVEGADCNVRAELVGLRCRCSGGPGVLREFTEILSLPEAPYPLESGILWLFITGTDAVLLGILGGAVRSLEPEPRGGRRGGGLRAKLRVEPVEARIDEVLVVLIFLVLIVTELELEEERLRELVPSCS